MWVNHCVMAAGWFCGSVRSQELHWTTGNIIISPFRQMTPERNRISPCVLGVRRRCVPESIFSIGEATEILLSRIIPIIPRDEEPNTNRGFVFFFFYLGIYNILRESKSQPWMDASERYGLVMFCGRRRALTTTENHCERVQCQQTTECW